MAGNLNSQVAEK